MVASDASEDESVTSEVISEWQVRSPFFFPLWTLLSSRPFPAYCSGKDMGWAEREGKAHIVINLQARVRSPQLASYVLQTSMLGTHPFFPCVPAHRQFLWV